MKLLSSLLLILNPIMGSLIVAACLTGYWYFSPLFMLVVFIILKFYFWTHKEECEAHKKWYEEYSKTHVYLGECYGVDYWKEKKTGNIIMM